MGWLPFFGPSPAAQEVFAAVQGRWRQLIDWGVSSKVPVTQKSITWWRAFEEAWINGDDKFVGDPTLATPESTLEAINAAAEGVNMAEAYAREAGFKATALPVAGVDIEQVSTAKKAAVLADHAATFAVGTAKELFNKAESADFPSIPWAKLGLGVGVILTGAGLLAAWSQKPTVVVAAPPTLPPRAP